MFAELSRTMLAKRICWIAEESFRFPFVGAGIVLLVGEFRSSCT
jgi:hypothetical protein